MYKSFKEKNQTLTLKKSIASGSFIKLEEIKTEDQSNQASIDAKE